MQITLTEQRLCRIWQRYAGRDWWKLNEYLWDVSQTLRACGCPDGADAFAEAAALALSRAVYAKALEVAA